jgi:antitoxin YefM
MFSTYRLKADELTDDFIKALKKAYKHREIEIIVQEVEDETEYLLKSEANRDHLLQAKEDIETGKNLVQVSLDSLE